MHKYGGFKTSLRPIKIKYSVLPAQFFQLRIPGRFSPPMPRRAPEGLDGLASRGAAGMPLVFGGLWIALPKTPFKPSGAQDQSGIGVAFSLGTFFWPSKRKYLGYRAETRC